MKNIIFIVSMLVSNYCFAGVYKCTLKNGDIIYSPEPILDCKGGDTPLKLEPADTSFEEQPEISRSLTERNERRKKFLDKLKVGDITFLGLVVQVKRPIAQIQTNEALKWYRIDHLYPADYFER